MILEYTYEKDKKFPHWVEQRQPAVKGGNLGVTKVMDINEWCGENFGELGIKWGFYREIPQVAGISLLTADYYYSWRFLEESDAMLFKLTWG